MRKRTVNYVADKLIWTLIYLLPLIVFAIAHFREGASTIEFANLGTFMSSNGFDIATDSMIYTMFVDIFGTNGFMPLVDTTSGVNGIIAYFSYFVITTMLHVFVDFIVFIPRLAHKWMSYFTRSEE